MSARPFVVLLIALCAAACAREERAVPTAAELPQRIVPANCSASELVHALVPVSRIAALPEQIDAYSTLDAKQGELARVPRFARYVAESVITLAPDLVVTHAWQNADTTAALKSRGLNVLVLPSSLTYDDLRESLGLVAHAVGSEERAAEVLRGLDARVATLSASKGARERWRALVYSNDGTGGTVAGSKTTIETVLGLAGVRNAASAAGIEGHVSADFERVLSIAPDVFVVGAPAVGEGGSPTKSVLESAAALSELAAIQKHRIVVLPAALLSADALSLVDAAEFVAREIDALQAREPR